MKFKRLIVLILLLMVLLTTASFGSDVGGNPDAYLLRKGYELSPEGLTETFKAVDPVAVTECLNYVDKMATNKSDYSVLIPYIEQYEGKLPNLPIAEGSRMVCIALRFVIQGNSMAPADRDRYVSRIRENLFVKDARHGAYSFSYKALLIAQKYIGLDIKDDLLYLAQSGSMNSLSKASAVAGPVRDLFALYPDRITPQEARDLHDAWPNNPKIQDHIRLHANSRGFLLELNSSESPSTP
ncbi:MAG: hypothetical protein IID08_08570 [Candidatus Hydrogenedentes bacterium]|nr:hypothetical protein [Candidatus Hydrogenedentota bacterium]